MRAEDAVPHRYSSSAGELDVIRVWHKLVDLTRACCRFFALLRQSLPAKMAGVVVRDSKLGTQDTWRTASDTVYFMWVYLVGNRPQEIHSVTCCAVCLSVAQLGSCSCSAAFSV